MTALLAPRVLPTAPYQRADVLALFETVIAAEPAYSPVVASGEQSVADWFDRKQTDWSRVGFDRGRFGARVIGHVAVRSHRTVPGGQTVLPTGRGWEMCRLAVHPDVRRAGLGADLVALTERSFGHGLWATCHVGSASHALLLGRGWTEVGPASWDDDPAPGACLVFGGRPR